jgi:heptosyltransferase III
MESSAKKVLIYKVGSLGDMMVSLPCFHLIARTFPNAERVLLTNLPLHAKAAPAESVLGSSGLIHGCIRYAMKRGGIWRRLFAILKFSPDVVVYLREIRPIKQVQRDAWFFKYICGVRRIVGVPLAAETRQKVNDNSGLYESEAVRLAKKLSVLGDAQPERIENWDLVLSETERAKANDALGDLCGMPLIACGPGTKMQAKDWGQESWRALLTRLSEALPDHGLVLVGAKEDAEVSDFASAGWNGPVRNLCGKLTPRETAAVMEHARVFLGPDSGPMHLAAAVGLPCVIAFASREYGGVWFPLGTRHRILYHEVECSLCRLVVCIENKRKCLTSITVDEMLGATLSAIGESGEPFGTAEVPGVSVI